PASMRHEVARSLAAMRPKLVSVMEVKVMTGSSVLFGVSAGAAAVRAAPVAGRAGQGPALSGLGVVLEVPAADDDHGAGVTAGRGAQTHRALDGHPGVGALFVDDAADHPRHRGQERAVLADDDLPAPGRDGELTGGAHRRAPCSCSRSLSPSRIRPARRSAGVPVGSIITVGAFASISATRSGSTAPSSAASVMDTGRVLGRWAEGSFGSMRVTGGRPKPAPG